MKNKTTVIHHSADFDGIFCREIARKFLPESELIGWDYNDKKIPFPSEGMVYVLDLSPECFDHELEPYELQRLIWIDHHKSAIEKFNKAIAGFRIDGVAACRLAWHWFTQHQKYFHPSAGSFAVLLRDKQDFIDRKVTEPYAVRLAGEYDIWDKRDPNADIFQFGLRSKTLGDDDWEWLLEGDETSILLNHLLVNGGLLQRYQLETDASVVKYRSFMVEWEGLKFLALTTARCNSLTFAAKDVPETGHDALMAFYYNGTGWTVSLYHANHRKDLDLSKIAVKYGGGGHRGACGFRVEKLPFISA